MSINKGVVYGYVEGALVDREAVARCCVSLVSLALVPTLPEPTVLRSPEVLGPCVRPGAEAKEAIEVSVPDVVVGAETAEVPALVTVLCSVVCLLKFKPVQNPLSAL
jgi:hypothetical protein